MRAVICCLVVVASALNGVNSVSAASKGTITGRVVHGATEEPQAGVEVTLTAANEDGSDRKVETFKTRADGRYTFEGLETGEHRIYTIDATYQGGFFPGRPITLPEDTEAPPVVEATLRVWETTQDPNAVLIRRDDMFAVLGDNGIGVIEAVTVVNQTDMAYIGRSASSGSTNASLGFSLPVSCEQASVSIVDADVDVPEIICSDFGFGITPAIPPGETRFTFSFRVPGETSTFDLSRTALYTIAEMSVYVAEPLTIESNRLADKGIVALAGKNYQRWTTRGPVDPGDPIQVVATAETGISLGYVAAGAGFLVFLSLILFLWFRRGREQPLPEEAPVEQKIRNEDALIRAIAALDIAYERGQMTQSEWSRRRKELRERLTVDSHQ